VYRGDGAHDVAAVSLIVERAGGRVTDRHGHDQPLDRPVNGAVGSNGCCHPLLVSAWAESPDLHGS
jgi:fructose-1,6-bisphosphatase/inositol monophosphatase family enzyme